MDHRLTVAELKAGYAYAESDGVYRCNFCGQQYEEGEVYRVRERFLTAGRAVRQHVVDSHGPPFAKLIAAGKKETGLTDVQREMMRYFYEGVPVKEIAKQTGTSPATVRYQRYSLKEKARQARVFLALYELMDERGHELDVPLPAVHSGAAMVDERYMISVEEEEKILRTAFSSTDPLVLSVFPSKEKKKVAILRAIAGCFRRNTRYTEKQVNEILKPIYGDYVTIRRYLIEYGFLDRVPDGSEYWLRD